MRVTNFLSTGMRSIKWFIFGWKDVVALAHSVGSWAEKQRVPGSGPSVEKKNLGGVPVAGEGQGYIQSIAEVRRATSQTPKCSHRVLP